jgi:hypothetical protein
MQITQAYTTRPSSQYCDIHIIEQHHAAQWNLPRRELETLMDKSNGPRTETRTANHTINVSNNHQTTKKKITLASPSI